MHRILIVSDEEFLRDVIRLSLADMQADVRCASDVPDMQLPVICIQMSGYPASRKIIISCDILLFQVLKCLAFGKYIFKPIRYISDRDAFDKIKIRYFPYFFKQFAFRLKREIHHHIILVQNGHCFYRMIDTQDIIVLHHDSYDR